MKCEVDEEEEVEEEKKRDRSRRARETNMSCTCTHVWPHVKRLYLEGTCEVKRFICVVNNGSRF